LCVVEGDLADFIAAPDEEPTDRSKDDSNEKKSG
jgi:hypothetical protein